MSLKKSLAVAASLALGAFGAVVTASQAPTAEGNALLEVATSDEHGPYLTDAEGRALYLFVADKGKKESTCYDACAKAWPPYTTSGAPRAGGGKVQRALIGTTTRKDGAVQVTYGGWPLYHFVKDAEPGQTNGHDVKGFGAEWYLVTPEGKQAGHE